MKILFSFYPLFVKFNAGVALLAAILKNKGIQVELSMAETLEEFKVNLDFHKPDYVGFSFVIERDYIKSIPFIRLAKELGYKVLAGGVYPRRVKINNPDIDYLCQGEAEILPDFLLDGDTTVFDKPYLHEDISNLPLLDYSLFKGIDIWYKRDYPFFKRQKVLPYYTSRGCPHRCSFCEVQYQPKGIRINNNCIPELSILKSLYSPDAFMFGDTLLPYSDELWREQFKDFYHPFFAYIRADITPKELTFLFNHGLVATAFGVESGNEEYRNSVLKKDLSNDEVMRTVELCRYFKIDFLPFYMTGTPGETPEIKQDTFEMSKNTSGVIWQYDELCRN